MKKMTKSKKLLFGFEQLYKWNIESMFPYHQSILLIFLLNSIMDVLFACQTNIQPHFNPLHATFYLIFVVNGLSMCLAYKRLKQMLAE